MPPSMGRCKMKMKVNIPNLKSAIKSLKKFDEIVFAIAERLKLYTLQNWLIGIGADDKKFDNLNQKYAAYKSKHGKNPIRNLNLSGLMAMGLTVQPAGGLRYKLGFPYKQDRDKARGNVEKAPAMIKPVSDRIDKKLQKEAYNLYIRGKK